MRFSTPQWNLTLGIDGVLTAGRFLRLRAMVWAAALFAGALFFFFASISMGTWAHLPRRANYLVASVVPCLAFVSYAWAVRIGEHRRAIEVVPVRRSALEFLAGAAIGFMMISVTLAVLWLFGLYSVHVSHWTNALDSFVFDSYISGMMEELAFRAILLRLLARGLGPLYGLIASSILFGAAHLSHATWLAAFEVAFNGGMVMGLLYMMTGRIWMSVGMHIAWDFTEESLLGVNSKTGLLLSTPVAGQPDILSGGNYGPDGSILAGIVGTIAILGIWYISARKKPSGSSLEAIAVIGRRDSDPVTKPCAKGAPCISVRAMAAHEKPAVRKSLNCRNCGVSAPDHYCPHCGQETREDPPSFREFVHEFILHYFAAEGRLWNTLAALVLHPGRLTIDYLRGRKLAYVLPLRLYLTVSVVFFLLLKIAAAPGNERVAAAFHRSLNDGQSSFAIVDLGFARAIRNADGSFDCNLATWFCNRIKDRLLREPGADGAGQPFIDGGFPASTAICFISADCLSETNLWRAFLVRVARAQLLVLGADGAAPAGTRMGPERTRGIYISLHGHGSARGLRIRLVRGRTEADGYWYGPYCESTAGNYNNCPMDSSGLATVIDEPAPLDKQRELSPPEF